MKNKIYKAILVTALAVAFATPVVTTPVYAGGTGWYWENEDPFITALWGKYSKFDGKLVYRVTGVEDVDFYTENIEEIKSYGFKISGEYVNERGETYYKFRYVGNAENSAVLLADTVTEEPIVKPDDSKTEITEDSIIKNYTVSDETYETIVEDSIVSDSVVTTDIVEDYVVSDETYETIVEDSIISDSVITTDIVEDYVVSDETYETIVEDLIISDSVITTDIVEDYTVNDYTVTDPEKEVISSSDALKVAMTKVDFYSEDNETFTTKMVDAKEIIWEEIYSDKEEPDTIFIDVPDTDIRIPWHEELLHNPANNLSGSEDGKELVWEWEGEPQVNVHACKTGACYQVDLSKNFTFCTENVDWILECGFEITGERTHNNGNVIYIFEYAK